MSLNFYHAFENKYRGSRELIKARLKVYLPFVEAIKALYGQASAVDLGCGRGEWLEVLGEQGINAHGVDLDDVMLKACRELGFSVETGDAVSSLKGLPDNSQLIVSAFHLAEHLPFDDLKILVGEALRVLKPCGLLILETPNPENIVVGTTNFYFDPTHQRPLPPQLLSFLPEYFGFERVKILRLQESVELATELSPTLLDVLMGVSPDYAVVAQKTGEPELMSATSKVFESDFGLTLECLANRYDQQAEERVQQGKVEAQQAKVEAQQAKVEAQQAKVEAQQAKVKAQQAKVEAQQAKAEAQQANALLNTVCNSRSWRMTRPLRLLGKSVRWFVRGSIAWVTFAPMSRPRRVLKGRLISLKNKIKAHPELKTFTLRFLSRFPMLKARLITMGNYSQRVTSITSCVESPEQLSPRARQIYSDFKTAIEHQKENC